MNGRTRPWSLGRIKCQVAHRDRGSRPRVDGILEKRGGWHGTGPVNTVAKLWGVNRLGDGRIQVGGHAYAGTRGIKTVEVSTDGGDNWTEAALSPQLSGVDVWRQWKYEWRPSTEVSTVVVRAVDGLGKSPAPRGVTTVSERCDRLSVENDPSVSTPNCVSNRLRVGERSTDQHEEQLVVHGSPKIEVYEQGYTARNDTDRGRKPLCCLGPVRGRGQRALAHSPRGIIQQ